MLAIHRVIFIITIYSYTVSILLYKNIFTYMLYLYYLHGHIIYFNLNVIMCYI